MNPIKLLMLVCLLLGYIVSANATGQNRPKARQSQVAKAKSQGAFAAVPAKKSRDLLGPDSSKNVNGFVFRQSTWGIDPGDVGAKADTPLESVDMMTTELTENSGGPKWERKITFRFTTKPTENDKRFARAISPSLFFDFPDDLEAKVIKSDDKMIVVRVTTKSPPNGPLAYPGLKVSQVRFSGAGFNPATARPADLVAGQKQKRVVVATLTGDYNSLKADFNRPHSMAAQSNWEVFELSLKRLLTGEATYSDLNSKWRSILVDDYVDRFAARVPNRQDVMRLTMSCVYVGQLATTQRRVRSQN